MDWIRRNLFFNRKSKQAANKVSEKDVVYDDEFVDIIEGEEVKCSKTNDPKAQFTSPTAQKKTKKSNVASDSVAEASDGKDPELAASTTTSTTTSTTEARSENRQFATQKAKQEKKKIPNNQSQQNVQLKNNIIHQPR